MQTPRETDSFPTAPLSCVYLQSSVDFVKAHKQSAQNVKETIKLQQLVWVLQTFLFF